MATPNRIVWSWDVHSIMGSTERYVDRSPDGTLWFFEFIIPYGNAHLWYSKDQGTTWSYGGDPVTPYSPLITTVWARGFHIDAEGYAHYVMRSGNSTINYYRGTPINGTKSFTWKWISFDPSPDALQPDSGSDLVAFRVGSGWKVFLLYTSTRVISGTVTNTQRLAEITINSSGGISLTNVTTVRTETGYGTPFGCLAFQHTGDGKTATATPHVYVISGVTTPDTTHPRQDPLRLYKHTYSSGAWTIAAPVTLDASTDLTSRTMRAIYDGQRIMVAYGTRDRTVGTSSAAIKMLEWVESSGTITQRNPAAYGGGYPLGCTASVELSSGDVHVTAYGATVDDPVYARWSRAAGTWTSWTSVASMNAAGQEGKINMPLYVTQSAVDLVYLDAVTYNGGSNGNQSPWIVQYLKLAIVNQAPSAPVLLAPSPSAVVDLATNGYTFKWRFVDPDPGDFQSAWAMRRKIGAGAYSYFNASSQTWGASIVWNSGADQSVSFAAAQWTNGNTYQWSVNTQDSSGAASGFATDNTVVASVAPTVAVNYPSGSYISDSSPVVGWTFTGTGTQQRTFQLKVFSLAQYNAGGFDPATSTAVYDSGEVATAIARTQRVGTALSNGTSYRAYMRVSDTNSIYSTWAYTEFLLMLTAAPAPLIEAQVGTDYNSGVRNVSLTVQGVSNMLSASQSYQHSDIADQTSNGTNPADTTYYQQASGGGASAIARQASGGQAGGAFIRQTFSSASTSVTGGIQYSNTTPDPGLVTRPGELVSASAWVRTSVAQRMQLIVQYIDDAGNVKLATSGTAVVTTANTWTQLTLTQTLAAPADTTRVRVYAYAVTGTGGVLWASGNTVDVDQLVVTNPGRADWNNDSNCAYGKTTSGATQGVQALSMTALATGDMRLVTGPGLQPLDTTGLPQPVQRDFSVEVGQTYTAIASFSALSTVRLARITLRWYSPADVLLGQTVGTGVADILNFPTQMVTTGVAPLGADRVRLVLEVLGASAGEVHTVDGIDLHPGLSTTFSPGGLTDTQVITAYRTLPDGTTSPIRAALLAPGDQNQKLVIVDREMPFGTDVSYTALVASILFEGQPLASQLSGAAVVNVDSDVWAVRDPLDASVGGEFRALIDKQQVNVDEQSGVYRPSGRLLPIVESEGVNGEDGSVSMTLIGPAERIVAKQLVARPTPMLLQSPIGELWYVRLSSRKRSSLVFQAQTMDLDYVEVDAP